jgi:hypothetical protein
MTKDPLGFLKYSLINRSLPIKAMASAKYSSKNFNRSCSLWIISKLAKGMNRVTVNDLSYSQRGGALVALVAFCYGNRELNCPI